MNNDKIIDFSKWRRAKDKIRPCLFCIYYYGDRECGELGKVPDETWYKLADCNSCIDYDDMEG